MYWEDTTQPDGRAWLNAGPGNVRIPQSACGFGNRREWRLLYVVRLGGNPVLPEARIEGPKADSELVGGLSSIARVRDKRRQDRLPLQFPQGLRRTWGQGGRGQGEVEMGGSNALFPAEDHRALDDVLKLPDVSGPGITLQERRHLAGETHDPFAEASARLPKDVAGERENIGGPFPEGRQRDRKDAEAVVEILPEDTLRHQALEIPGILRSVRRRW